MSETTTLLIRILCPFSILTNVALIVCVRTMKRLQGQIINNCQEYLAASDIVTSIIFMIGSDVSRTNPNLCTVLGAVMQFSLLSISTWSFLVGLLCYLTVVHSAKYANACMPFLHIYGWGIPALSVVGLFVIQAAWQRGTVFGDATYECWISPAYRELRVSMFYIPLWIQFAMTATVYLRTIGLVRRIMRAYSDASDSHSRGKESGPVDAQEGKVRRSNRRLVVRSGMLLAGFVVTWVPATVARVQEMQGQETTNTNWWLQCAVAVSFGLSGVWNSGVFLMGVWMAQRDV